MDLQSYEDLMDRYEGIYKSAYDAIYLTIRRVLTDASGDKNRFPMPFLIPVIDALQDQAINLLSGIEDDDARDEMCRDLAKRVAEKRESKGQWGRA